MISRCARELRVYEEMAPVKGRVGEHLTQTWVIQGKIANDQNVCVCLANTLEQLIYSYIQKCETFLLGNLDSSIWCQLACCNYKTSFQLA